MDDPIDYPAAHDLLDARLYLQVVEILQQQQVANEQRGDRTAVYMLGMAQRLCEACHQFHLEANQHQHAREEANKREREFRQYIHAFLDLLSRRQQPQLPGGQEQLSESEMIEPQPLESIAPPPEEHPSLWQRLQSFLECIFTPLVSISTRKTARAAGEPEPPSCEETELSAPFSQEDSFSPTSDSESPISDRNEPGPFTPTSSEITAQETAVTSAAEAAQQRGPSSPSLAVHCLGPFRVQNNCKSITAWPGRKCMSVFKYLILHRRQPVHSEILMDLFWSEATPEAARHNLHQAIYQLRRTLQSDNAEFDYVLYKNGGYYLNPEITIWLDSEVFRAHYKAGQRLDREGRRTKAVRAYEAADALYGGEFLTEDRYEDWPLLQREQLRHAHLDILDRLSRYYFTEEEFIICIAFCQKILNEDRCREDAHRRLMRSYVQQGQRYMAIRQYHLCVEALAEDLNVQPMPITVELYQEIQESDAQF